MLPRNYGKTQHVEIVAKGIEDVAKRAYAKFNGELILKFGTIKMLAMVGEFEKIIEICNETLEYFEQAAEQRVKADALPCGHNAGIIYGENDWTCGECGQSVRRLR